MEREGHVASCHRPRPRGLRENRLRVLVEAARAPEGEGCVEEGRVRVRYDKPADILYPLFKEGPSHEVAEADPDVHLELDEDGSTMGIEIWDAGKRGITQQVVEAAAETASQKRAAHV